MVNNPLLRLLFVMGVPYMGVGAMAMKKGFVDMVCHLTTDVSVDTVERLMEFIDGAGRLKGGAKALVTWRKHFGGSITPGRT